MEAVHNLEAYAKMYCTMRCRGVTSLKTAKHPQTPPSQSQLCHIKKKTPWPESASELYRPSDRSLSAKLVPILPIEGATRSVRRIQRPYSRFYRSEPLFFLPSSSSFVLKRLEWTPFQTHYFSDNLIALGIEPRTLGLLF
jgi:hypothetical protein